MSMTVEHAARPFFGHAYMSRPLRQSHGLDWIDLALIAVFFAGICCELSDLGLQDSAFPLRTCRVGGYPAAVAPTRRTSRGRPESACWWCSRPT